MDPAVDLSLPVPSDILIHDAILEVDCQNEDTDPNPWTMEDVARTAEIVKKCITHAAAKVSLMLLEWDKDCSRGQSRPTLT